MTTLAAICAISGFFIFMFGFWFAATQKHAAANAMFIAGTIYTGSAFIFTLYHVG